MKIGLDLDNTISNTSEILHDRLKKYAVKLSISSDIILEDEYRTLNFYKEYTEDIFDNVEVKENAKEVIDELKDNGHEIYIITARTTDFISEGLSAKEMTFDWLKKHKIFVDDIITGVYGKSKAEVCKRLNIDLMVDDDPHNYQEITKEGIKCLLFDDKKEYEKNEDIVTNWLEIKEFIERG